MRKRDMYIRYDRTYKRRGKRRGRKTFPILMILILAIGIGVTSYFLILNF